MGEPTITSLAVTVAEIRGEVSNLTTSVAEIKSDVKEMKSTPAKRWNGLVAQTISLIVAMVFGLIMAKIGIV